MGEKLSEEEPVMMSEPDYKVRPMKDVEEEFLKLFHQLQKEITEDE